MSTQNPTPSISRPQDVSGLYPFPDCITISPTLEAATFAFEVYSQGAHIPRCLILWVDGSAGSRFQPCSGAIGYHDPRTNSWREYITLSLLSSDSLANEAELLAICEGLRLAQEMTDYFDRLIIFSDSQAMLKCIRDLSKWKFLPDLDLVNRIFEIANEMYDEGIQVAMHWVPADAGIEGHKRVDVASREVRRIATQLWPKEACGCNVAIRPITLMARCSEEARDELQALLRDGLWQVQEEGLVVHCNCKRQELRSIHRRANKRIKRRMRRVIRGMRR